MNDVLRKLSVGSLVFSDREIGKVLWKNIKKSDRIISTTVRSFMECFYGLEAVDGRGEVHLKAIDAELEDNIEDFEASPGYHPRYFLSITYDCGIPGVRLVSYLHTREDIDEREFLSSIDEKSVLENLEVEVDKSIVKNEIMQAFKHLILPGECKKILEKNIETFANAESYSRAKVKDVQIFNIHLAHKDSKWPNRDFVILNCFCRFKNTDGTQTHKNVEVEIHGGGQLVIYELILGEHPSRQAIEKFDEHIRRFSDSITIADE